MNIDLMLSDSIRKLGCQRDQPRWGRLFPTQGAGNRFKRVSKLREPISALFRDVLHL